MSPVTAQRRIPSGKAAALRRVAPAAARVSKITPVYSPLIQRKPACACGGVCPKCRSQENLQPKLKIGAPDDKYEREADRVADRIMRQPLSEKEEEETVQAKAVPGQEMGSSIAIPDGFLAGGGRLLPPSTKHFLESRLGHDFSHVRIHDGAPAAEAAQSINARAFTLGRDVVFNKGEYSPDSDRGKRLLAHELTHVIQQGGGSGRIQRQPIFPDNSCTRSQQNKIERHTARALALVSKAVRKLNNPQSVAGPLLRFFDVDLGRPGHEIWVKSVIRHRLEQIESLLRDPIDNFCDDCNARAQTVVNRPDLGITFCRRIFRFFDFTLPHQRVNTIIHEFAHLAGAIHVDANDGLRVRGFTMADAWKNAESYARFVRSVQ